MSYILNVAILSHCQLVINVGCMPFSVLKVDSNTVYFKLASFHHCCILVEISWNDVFQSIWFHVWNHRSEINPNTCGCSIDDIIFAKFLARIFLQICSAGQEGILCLAKSTTSSACSQGISHSSTPVCLNLSFRSSGFQSLGFLQSWIVLSVSTWAFVAWIFGGCQLVF